MSRIEIYIRIDSEGCLTSTFIPPTNLTIEPNLSTFIFCVPAAFGRHLVARSSFVSVCGYPQKRWRALGKYPHWLSSLVKHESTHDEEECVSSRPARVIFFMFFREITRRDVLSPCPDHDEFRSKDEVSHDCHPPSKDCPLRISRRRNVGMDGDPCTCEYH